MDYIGGFITKNPTAPTTTAASGMWKLALATQYIKAGTWPLQPVLDPYFDYTTLLLPGNGTNGAQNNTFLDSSTNNFTITRNGNTTQGTFSPFSQTGWSNYFNGDYLTVADNTALQMGSGDFTIEFWINFNSISGYQTPFDKGYTGTGGLLFQTGNGNGRMIIYASGSAVITETGTASTGVWIHYALVRSGTTLTLYRDGVSSGSATNSTNFNNTGVLGIARNGANLSPNYPAYAYMSNVRIVKGTAVYTSSFTPPTAPLTAITNTSLLTCQSNRFIDNSSNAFTITVNGSPSVQAFSPFAPTTAWSASTNGGSGYFDGTGDYLTAANNSAFALSADFTIELWAYFNSNTTSIFCGNINSSGYGDWAFFYNSAAGIRFLTDNGATTITGTYTVTPNTWTHIAISRSGTSVKIFADGVLLSTTTNSSSNTFAGTMYVGRANDGGFQFPGYMSGLRIVKGTAVYTAAFTPPTAPPTNITNTSLLLNYTNAGIYDATAKNDLETVGNAQISTTQSKFGGSSMYFDGTGDYLTVPNSQNFVFGSGNWTVECWVYLNATGRQGFVALENSAGTNVPWELGLNASNKFRILVQTSAGQVVIDGTTTPSTSTWYHLAAVRNGSTVTLYVNGTSEATGSVSTNALVAETNPIYVGQYAYGFQMNGYIDDLRITKGVARYTANFTPPTAAFPTQ